MKPKIRIVALSKLILDDANANVGTKRGRELLAKSLAKYGTGRSVLVDKNNRVIAGNKTVEQARAAGMKSIAVIEGDGSDIVADTDASADANTSGDDSSDDSSGDDDSRPGEPDRACAQPPPRCGHR